jgi:hypothetical protein
MRVFVPATLPLLARWHAARVIDAPLGFAVTPALREWYAAGDAEELEYVALIHAAHESIRLLTADPDAPARRIVVAAEAERAVPDAGVGPAAVRLATPLPFQRVAAVHADAAEEPVVRTAVAAIGAADAGDLHAQSSLDEAEAVELSWYATQEIPDLLAGP